MRLSLCFVLTVLIFAVVEATPTSFLLQLKNYDLPQNEVIAYLRKNLKKGYDLVENNNNSDKLPLLSDYEAAELYKFVMQRSKVIANTNTPFSTIICFDDGRCIDLDDPGIYP